MRPAGGWFSAPADLARGVRVAAQATNELSMEIVVEPPPGGGNGTIVELSQGNHRLLRLRQEGRRLLFGVLDRKWSQPMAEVELLHWEGVGKRHLAVSYSAGRLAAFLDGQPIDLDAARVAVLQGAFFHWRDADLTFGGGDAAWAGTIEGVAFYDRLLSAAEVHENARRYAQQIAERPKVDRWVARVRRRDCSPAPSLAAIAPYREALRVCRYDVLEGVGSESALGPVVEAARWAILDGREVALPPAAERRIALERFADNRQLESLYVEDTFGPASRRELFYVVE
jgi:hypothetical protein